MQDDAPATRSPARLAALLALVFVFFAGFSALGVWQVRRLAWKEALIARVDARVHAQPASAPASDRWPELSRDADEYRRVQLQGEFDFGREVLVHASTMLGAGYWVLTPMRTGAGDWVFVNRGFVPTEMRDQVPHADASPSRVGLLRFTEPRGRVLQSNDPAQGRWYSRDVAAMASAMHIEGNVAPYFVDQQTVTAADRTAWPRPGLTVIDFPNNHLVYALTWFALAAGCAAAAAYVIAHHRAD